MALLVAVMTAACGRIGYGDDGGGDDVDADTTDADPDAIDLGPLHEYHFNGNYLDDKGGPAMVGRGGTFVAGGYQFAANQGLDVTGALPDRVYTVDIVFEFDDLVGWDKILDFKNLTTDEGYYTYDTSLQFVVVAGSTFATGPQGLPANTLMQTTLTRDAAGLTIGYVNRSQVFMFTDTAGVATLDAPGAIAHFFVDDTATGMGEATGGTVRRIMIWDRALTPSELPQ
jgi:hypothetical protein